MKQWSWSFKIPILVWQLSSCLAIHLPQNYGKTQFIIGATEKDLRSQAARKPIRTKPRTIPITQLVEASMPCVFFSPDDNIINLLIDCIKHEQQSIKMAIYMITQKTVAQALVDAHNRGVRIEIITDNFCSKSESGAIALLKRHKMPIYVYSGHSEIAKISDIMHHKFIIFEKNIQNSPLIWTGSFNVTHSAQQNNQENVVVMSDMPTIRQFTKHFEILKQRCQKTTVTNYHQPSRFPSARKPFQQKKRKHVAHAKRSRRKIVT